MRVRRLRYWSVAADGYELLITFLFYMYSSFLSKRLLNIKFSTNSSATGETTVDTSHSMIVLELASVVVSVVLSLIASLSVWLSV